MVHASSILLPALLFQVPCLSAVFLLSLPMTIFLTRAICDILTSSLFPENRTIFLKINNSVYIVVGFLFTILFYYPFISLSNSMKIIYFGTVDIPTASPVQQIFPHLLGTIDIPTPILVQ
jgi:hypothetical protein